jgi:hypothetical protein
MVSFDISLITSRILTRTSKDTSSALSGETRLCVGPFLKNAKRSTRLFTRTRYHMRKPCMIMNLLQISFLSYQVWFAYFQRNLNQDVLCGVPTLRSGSVFEKALRDLFSHVRLPYAWNQYLQLPNFRIAALLLFVYIVVGGAHKFCWIWQKVPCCQTGGI